MDVFRNCGYKVELLTTSGPNIVQEGLKYVHNDTCYPALLVIGQFIDALQSGKYDLDKTALIITQTGGGCRRQQLHPSAAQGAAQGRAGADPGHLPEPFRPGAATPAFPSTLSMIRKMVAAVVYGDALMAPEQPGAAPMRWKRAPADAHV